MPGHLRPPPGVALAASTRPDLAAIAVDDPVTFAVGAVRVAALRGTCPFVAPEHGVAS